MPDRKTTKRAQQDLQAGKSASTAAGEFVREEMHHSREGKHSTGNPKQAIAIGLSKARQAGVPLRPPKSEQRSEKPRQSGGADAESGPKSKPRRASSPRRASATKRAAKKTVRTSATKKAMPRSTKSASRRSKSRTTRRSSKRAAA